MTVFKNRVILQKNIMRTYGGGRPIGYAHQFSVLEGYWKPNTALGIFEFESANAANRWCQSDPRFRVRDWLDDHEVWMVPMQNQLESYDDQNTFIEMSLLKISNMESFLDIFLPKWEKSIRSAGGNPTVCSSKVTVWAGTKDVDYLYLTQWPDAETAYNWRKSDEGVELINQKQTITSGCTVTATMNFHPKTAE